MFAFSSPQTVINKSTDLNFLQSSEIFSLYQDLPQNTSFKGHIVKSSDSSEHLWGESGECYGYRGFLEPVGSHNDMCSGESFTKLGAFSKLFHFYEDNVSILSDFYYSHSLKGEDSHSPLTLFCSDEDVLKNLQNRSYEDFQTISFSLVNFDHFFKPFSVLGCTIEDTMSQVLVRDADKKEIFSLKFSDSSEKEKTCVISALGKTHTISDYVGKFDQISSLICQSFSALKIEIGQKIPEDKQRDASFLDYYYSGDIDKTNQRPLFVLPIEKANGDITYLNISESLNPSSQSCTLVSRVGAFSSDFSSFNDLTPEDFSKTLFASLRFDALACESQKSFIKDRFYIEDGYSLKPPVPSVYYYKESSFSGHEDKKFSHALASTLRSTIAPHLLQGARLGPAIVLSQSGTQRLLSSSFREVSDLIVHNKNSHLSPEASYFLTSGVLDLVSQSKSLRSCLNVSDLVAFKTLKDVSLLVESKDPVKSSESLKSLFLQGHKKAVSKGLSLRSSSQDIER